MPRAFITPVVDFWLMGGASFLCFLFFWISPSEAWTVRATSLSLTLLWWVNWPHFAATWQRVYSSTPLPRQVPWLARITLVASAMLLVSIFLWPFVVTPALVKIYALWAGFHFTAQSFGLACVYAAKQGTPLSGPLRGWVFGYLVALFLLLIAKVESSAGAVQVLGITTSGFGISSGWIHAAEALVAATAVGLVADLARRRTPLSVLVWLPVASQTLWFGWGTEVAAFNALVPFFHSVQYLVIAFATQEPKRSFLAWYRWNFLLGAMLFWGAWKAATLLGLPDQIAMASVFAIANLQHFVLDTLLWKSPRG